MTSRLLVVPTSLVFLPAQATISCRENDRFRRCLQPWCSTEVHFRTIVLGDSSWCWEALVDLKSSHRSCRSLSIMLGWACLCTRPLPARIHDQLLYHGNLVTLYDQCPLLQGPTIEVAERTRKALERRGHSLLPVDYLGTTQAISVDFETDLLTAVSDPRKGGIPAGY